MSLNHFEYFITLAICIFVPLLLALFHPGLQIRKNMKWALLAILITCVPFWAWDVVATYIGHWGFNPNFITGFYIYNLPIEEVLFFVVIPFSCLTIWAEIKSFTTWSEFWRRFTFREASSKSLIK
jgi:lycopene cyclase domain-containing protein